MAAHDALFRATFSNPDRAAELVRSVLPAEVCRLVDWSSLRVLGGDRIGKVLEERRIDLLLAASIAGRETHLMFLVEHRSTPQARMVLRMLEYMAVLWRSAPESEPLVPIVPIVVHHGAMGWTAPRSMRELFDVDPALEAALGERLVSLTLTIDDLARVTPEQIAARQASAIARLVLGMLRDARTVEDVGELLARWAALVTAVLREDPELGAALLVLRYISQVRDEPLDEVIEAARRIGPKAEEAAMTLYDRLIAEGEAKGRAEGEAEGEAKGKAELVLRMLTLRFGATPPELAERVRTARVDELDAMAERILTAASAAEVVG